MGGNGTPKMANGESDVTLYLASLYVPVPVLMATMRFSPPMSWTVENLG